MLRKLLLPAACVASTALLLTGFPHSAGAAAPVKVFVLCGQSNMEGKAKVSLLEYQVKQEKTKQQFQHLVDKQGGWVERDDVWIKFLGRQGRLTVGYGSPNCIGPELEFGNTVGDHYDEPVLIIKAAWGGKSLYRDFRPPSAGLPPEEVLAKQLEQLQKKKPGATIADVKEGYGRYYRLTLEEVRGTVDNLGERFPQFKGREPQLAGFVWFQGWNDMINSDYTAEYADNMACFIRDIRKDLNSPKLPFVIGQLGVGGVEQKPNAKKDAFKAAQIAPAGLAEFQGNVAVVKTDQYWDKTADAVFKKGLAAELRGVADRRLRLSLPLPRQHDHLFPHRPGVRSGGDRTGRRRPGSVDPGLGLGGGLRRAGQFTQPLPGEQPRRMAVAPHDPHGVGAD